MTTTIRPSKRRSTRLRKGTLDLLAYNVREKALTEAGTTEAQGSKKRPAQNHNEKEAPAAKRTAVSKQPSKPLMKRAIEGPGRAAQRFNEKLMEVIEEQEETPDSGEESDLEGSDAEETDSEESDLKEFMEPPSHRGANQGAFTLLKKVKEAQSKPLVEIPDSIRQNPTTRVTKHSGKTVTFVPTPDRKPKRRTSNASLSSWSINQENSSTFANEIPKKSHKGYRIPPSPIPPPDPNKSLPSNSSPKIPLREPNL